MNKKMQNRIVLTMGACFLLFLSGLGGLAIINYNSNQGIIVSENISSVEFSSEVLSNSIENSSINTENNIEEKIEPEIPNIIVEEEMPALTTENLINTVNVPAEEPDCI